MRSVVVSVLICMFCLPSIVMARRDTGPPEWTFNDSAELVDWQDHHNLKADPEIVKVRDSRGNERSVLVLESAGDSAYIYPGGEAARWEPFDGYSNGTIYIGLRVSESDIWQVYYKTSKNGEYIREQSQQFEVEAGPDFVGIELEMHWQNMISGFRIHPGIRKNIRAEIDYLSLRGPEEATQPTKKLATSWGRIKDLF